MGSSSVYLAHKQRKLKPRSYSEAARHLKNHAKPLHKNKAVQVTQRMVVVLLEDKAKASPIAANRLRANLSAMFAWGMKAGLVLGNPVAATYKPAEEKTRERVLTDRELALIWGSAASAADHDRIVRLLMLTGARREEVAGMSWSEVTLNSDGTAEWVLPSNRSKNHRVNEITLPAPAVGALPPPREREDGKPRDLIFGARKGPFSGWSNCKTRLDSRITAANNGAPLPAWVLHDLRRTFVTSACP
jgi:integrase